MAIVERESPQENPCQALTHLWTYHGSSVLRILHGTREGFGNAVQSRPRYLRIKYMVRTSPTKRLLDLEQLSNGIKITKRDRQQHHRLNAAKSLAECPPEVWLFITLHELGWGARVGEPAHGREVFEP